MSVEKKHFYSLNKFKVISYNRFCDMYEVLMYSKKRWCYYILFIKILFNLCFMIHLPIIYLLFIRHVLFVLN